MESGEIDRSLISFTPAGSTLLVHDELEGQSFSLEVGSTFSLEPALVDLFHFPVDAAVSFSATEFTIGQHANVLLRDETGDVVTEATEDSQTALQGTYYLDITAPVKTYVRLSNAEPTLAYTGEQYESPVQVTLESETTVTVGARSPHARPQATITVPDDPIDRMDAFSYLGSSIKEFSPERSWPTLRGHPPRFERGSTLDIPESLSKPDTGIRVTIPPTHANLYRVAPLAFYFGATIEPGEQAALHLPNGYSEPLVTQTRTLEASVDHIVSSSFLLDTLVRQNGYNPITVRAYDEVGPHLPFYPEALADEPLAMQLMEYLEAPAESVLDVLPRWTTSAVLRPDPADVTLIPYLLDSLSRIHVTESPPRPEAVREQALSSPLAVGYTHADSPAGGVELRESAFERRLTRDVPTADEAVVAFVTHNTDRADWLRAQLDRAPLRNVPERVEIHAAPTRGELRTLLTEGADLVVTDLSATGSTLTCADGALDLATLSEIRPTAVVFDEDANETSTAAAVVDAGATVTLTAPSVTAPEPGLRLVGCVLAGQSLAGAASLVYDDDDYSLVGVPAAVAVRRREGTNAACYHVEAIAPGEYAVSFATSPTEPIGLGGVNRAGEEFSHGDYQLAGSSTQMPTTVSTDRVVDLLSDSNSVVVLNGEARAGEVTLTAALVESSARRALKTRSAGGELTN